MGFNAITYGLKSFGIDSTVQDIVAVIMIVIIMTYTTNKDNLMRILEKTFGIKRRKMMMDLARFSNKPLNLSTAVITVGIFYGIANPPASSLGDRTHGRNDRLYLSA